MVQTVTAALLRGSWQPTRFVGGSLLSGEVFIRSMLKDTSVAPGDFAFLTQIVPAARREGGITREHKGHLFFFFSLFSNAKLL